MQDIILVMLEYHARSRTHMRKKEGTRSHTFVLVVSVGIRQEVIDMNNFTKEARINNPEIAR